MSALKYVNLALAFGLELAALAALGYWGWHASAELPLQLGLALGAPLLMAVVWGLWLAPRAAQRLPNPARAALQLGIFGIAALALVGAGQPGPAITFAGLVVVNTLLLHIWHQ